MREASPTAASGGGRPVRVFVVDDHEVVREGTRSIVALADDLELVGEAASCAEALARIPATRPDVVLLDLHLPDGTGLDVCRGLRSSGLDVRCVVLSSFVEPATLDELRGVGASGYLLKHVRSAELVAQIHRVCAGEFVLDAELAHAPPPPARSSAAARVRALSPLELRILAAVSAGGTNRRIAGELNISEKTVKNYVSSILRKLMVERRAAAAVIYEQARHELALDEPDVARSSLGRPSRR